MAKVATFQHPELGHALRFLRARRGLSQAAVAEQVVAGGGRLTSVWLSRIESAADRTGGPFPSFPLLERILAALGSDRAGLDAVLRERPWTRVAEGSEWDEDPPPPDIAAEAAELGALYARLPRAEQVALLTRARRGR
jgi:transcriptional regulator with XRE-family HTH domain